MFDIGFWELMLIGIMGLIILGPERLPIAIRTIRGWIGGVRKFSDTVKTELSEELRIQEMHANLKKAEQSGMKNLSPELAESVKSLQDAADMVNEPFKKVDTSALDSLISDSLASSNVVTNEAIIDAPDSPVVNSQSENSNDSKHIETSNAKT